MGTGINFAVLNIIIRVLSFFIEIAILVFVQFKYSFIEATREEDGLAPFHVL